MVTQIDSQVQQNFGDAAGRQNVSYFSKIFDKVFCGILVNMSMIYGLGISKIGSVFGDGITLLRILTNGSWPTQTGSLVA